MTKMTLVSKRNFKIQACLTIKQFSTLPQINLNLDLIHIWLSLCMIGLNLNFRIE